jgi:glutaryl-CoA dehydrogenase
MVGAERPGPIESIHTFEGTETIQTLIVGRDITGIGAFS